MKLKRIAALLAAALLLFAALCVSAANISYGSRGDTVKKIQQRLKQWGYYTGSVDGIFGSGTLAAVKSFQRKNGLKADGIVGKQTAAAMGIARFFIVISLLLGPCPHNLRRSARRALQGAGRDSGGGAEQGEKPLVPKHDRGRHLSEGRLRRSLRRADKFSPQRDGRPRRARRA